MRPSSPLQPVKTVHPSLGQSHHRGVVHSAKPDQFYQVRLGQHSRLNLSLSGLSADANLSLLNQQGKTLVRSARYGQQSESITRSVKPGTYYVRVSRQQGATQYHLTIDPTTDQTTSPTSPTTSQTAPEGFSSRQQRQPKAASRLRKVVSSNPLVNQVLKLVNQQRNQAGLKPMKLNARLNNSAQAYSRDMAVNDFFGHVSPNGSTHEERILAAGYNYAVAGENIAAGFSTAATVVQGWMASPSHRANILHPMLTEMGVGFYLLENDTGASNYRYYWTQHFGKPMN